MSQRATYEAKCSVCNEVAVVPFKPTPGKPVYCKSCFSKRLTNPSTRIDANRNFEPKQAWARRR